MNESEEPSVPNAGAGAVAGAGAAGTRAEHTCCLLGALVGVALVAALVGVILMKEPAEESSRLRRLYVLVAHGERTPSAQELSVLGSLAPPNLFAPFGVGAMTLEGKMLVFEMGALLRKRYGEFLGPYFNEETMSVVSTWEALSQTTALLVSAGLYPPAPAQRWDPAIAWQPVPYTYPEPEDDYLLYEQNCPRYVWERRRVLAAWEAEGLLAAHRDTLARLAQLTQHNYTVHDAALLHNLFVIQDQLKLPVPRWARHVRRRLAELARLDFSLAFHTDLLRTLSGGALLQQIVSWLELESDGAVVIRAGSPRHVAALLSACVGPPPRAPDPGVALLIELHEIQQPPQQRQHHNHPLPTEQRTGIKIYYWDDDSAEPRGMDVPGCGEGEFCSLAAFRALTAHSRTDRYRDDCKLPPSATNH